MPKAKAHRLEIRIGIVPVEEGDVPAAADLDGQEVRVLREIGSREALSLDDMDDIMADGVMRAAREALSRHFEGQSKRGLLTPGLRKL